jgi:hypothetical protein
MSDVEREQIEHHHGRAMYHMNIVAKIVGKKVGDHNAE